MPRIALIAAALLLGAAPAFAQSVNDDVAARTLEQNRRAVNSAPPAAAAAAQQAGGTQPANRPLLGRPSGAQPTTTRPTSLALAQGAGGTLAR